jgi:hypothetical protein
MKDEQKENEEGNDKQEYGVVEKTREEDNTNEKNLYGSTAYTLHPHPPSNRANVHTYATHAAQG